MKVLFLMIAYPDVALNTNMYTDLTSEFQMNGHDVYVVAPHNNLTKIYNEEGIKVLRIKTLPLFNVSLVRKGIANVLLPYQYKRAISKFFKGIAFDLIITPTPPITFNSIVNFLKRKYNSKMYLILRDIFPQNGKDLGLIKNALIFNYFRRIEKKLYSIADSIGCMSQKNIDFVIAHNPELNQEKLHLLPNWSKISIETRQPSDLRSRLNLTDKFVAVFGGNFGIPQNIDFLIEVAEKLKDHPVIVFILIGEGTEKNRIKKLVLELRLGNVIIMDQLPRIEYSNFLKECDVGLVNLSSRFTIPNIPSRTLSYWSLKLPVLAAIDKCTDYGKMLENCDGGLWSYSDDVDDYISKLISFQNDPEKKIRMGENGYNYLKSELNPGIAYRTIVSSI